MKWPFIFKWKTLYRNTYFFFFKIESYILIKIKIRSSFVFIGSGPGAWLISFQTVPWTWVSRAGVKPLKRGAGPVGSGCSFVPSGWWLGGAPVVEFHRMLGCVGGAGPRGEVRWWLRLRGCEGACACIDRGCPLFEDGKVFTGGDELVVKILPHGNGNISLSSKLFNQVKVSLILKETWPRGQTIHICFTQTKRTISTQFRPFWEFKRINIHRYNIQYCNIISPSLKSQKKQMRSVLS